MTAGLIRLLVFLHRWVGIVIGLVMLMWCLTGVVMIYVAYPSLPEDARLAALPPLIKAVPTAPALADGDPVERFEVEMQGGQPVVRIGRKGPPPAPDAMLATARGYDGRARLAGIVKTDQWTVGGPARQGPLYRYDLGDAGRTWLYVSSQTGKAVQRVNGGQRFWNWLGAIPHWLYPTVLRTNVKLWSQVVIWLSATGVFLTVIGLVLGAVRLRLRKTRLSPYRGWLLWHHLGGMALGLFVLTWVFSGLLSMNPWGLLETAPGSEAEDLRGKPPSWGQVRPAITAILANPASAGAVSLRSSLFDGRIYAMARWPDGRQMRFDGSGAPAPLAADDLQRIGRVLDGPVQTLAREDDYYFATQHERAPLPVLRVVASGGDHRRYYLDPASGDLRSVLDGAGRGYRWWMEGLHRLDFTATLRARPWWDGLMIMLLAGAGGVCLTGVWIGVRRLRLKFAYSNPRASGPPPS